MTPELLRQLISMNHGITSVTRLAMQLATVKRGLNRPDGRAESDTDHSVQVAWLACSLAQAWYPGLDTGTIAQLALVHDAAEIYAGDVYAVTAGATGRETKRAREHAATERITGEVGALTWLPATMARYERQILPEARFVWATDKIVTKIACLEDGCAELKLRATAEQVRDYAAYEKAIFDERAAEFPKMIELRAALVAQLPWPSGLS
jgi:5'-deoxynucleotidase YfbR-like HD superfamily hydrolase